MPMNKEIEQNQEEIESLKKEVERLKDELVRLLSRNLDLSERLEYDVELRRRTEVAREIMEGNIERQRNADLRDDGQLMALIEMRVEKERPHLKPDFDAAALAEISKYCEQTEERNGDEMEGVQARGRNGWFGAGVADLTPVRSQVRAMLN